MMLLSVEDQQVVEQGVVAGMGQGTDAVDGDLEKPVYQCASCEELGTAENNDAEDGQEAVGARFHRPRGWKHG